MMKSLPALLLYLLLALSPLGAQAHAGMTHCQDGPMATAEHAPSAAQIAALHTADDAMALNSLADSQPCPHHNGGSCHCTHACSGASAAVTMIPHAALPIQRGAEAPAAPLTLAMRAALPLDLLRPPTTTL